MSKQGGVALKMTSYWDIPSGSSLEFPLVRPDYAISYNIIQLILYLQ